jgi:soluble lytic murein transglycosylase-like protein
MEKIMKYLLFLVTMSVQAGNFDQLIAAQEARRQIPTGLLYKIVQVESNFRPNAVNKDARIWSYGLTQLTESTAMETCMLPMSKIMEPERNIDCGARVLMLLLQKYSVRHAVAAYNSGTPCVCVNGSFRFVGPSKEDYGSCGGECTMIGAIKNSKYVNLVLNSPQPKTIPTLIAPAAPVALPGIPVHAR